MTDETAATVADDTDIFGTLLPARHEYPPPDMALTVAVVMAGRRWRSHVDEKLRVLGHSISRLEVISCIAYAPPDMTQTQIAKLAGIEGPTLTRTLDMLEADRLVERIPDPTDRRTKLMRVTPAGYDALAKMLVITQKLRDDLLEGISPEDIRAGYKFVSTLLRRLEGY